jgi:hypothetical protein
MRGYYKDFLDYLSSSTGRLEIPDERALEELMDVLKVWSVDTCQMWLNGFGKILDDIDGSPEGSDDTSTVLQIPGDVTQIEDFEYYVEQIKYLALVVEDGKRTHPPVALCVGDYDIKLEGAKHLIDVYGTFPLLFNWFPTVAAKLRAHPHNIKRPRSEFFAVSVAFLREMLKKRKFAYEQTMAFLVYALFDNEGEAGRENRDDRRNTTQSWQIQRRPIGTVRDYGAERGFREATDQIERAERMLKVLWRESHGGDTFNVDDFERLDRRSTAIREAAMVCLENILRPVRSSAARPQT